MADNYSSSSYQGDKKVVHNLLNDSILANMSRIAVPPNGDPTKFEKSSVRELIIAQEKKYENLISEKQCALILDQNPLLVRPLLDTFNLIDKTVADLVVVKNVQESLPCFKELFEAQPFYVLSVYSPYSSYKVSEMINTFTEEIRSYNAEKRHTLERVWEGAQDKAADFNRKLQENIQEIQAAGFTRTQDIVDQLNRKGLKTRRGEDWEIYNFYRAQKQIEKIQSNKL